MDARGLTSLAVGLAITAFFAWLEFKERSSLRDTAQSMLFPHTISEKNAPFMFQTYKLMVTFGAYFFTVIAVFVGLALVSKLIGVL